jgi:hypothetical protein
MRGGVYSSAPAGGFSCRWGDFAAARPLLEESARLDREAGDRAGLMISLMNVSLAVDERPI